MGVGELEGKKFRGKMMERRGSGEGVGGNDGPLSVGRRESSFCGGRKAGDDSARWAPLRRRSRYRALNPMRMASPCFGLFFFFFCFF